MIGSNVKFVGVLGRAIPSRLRFAVATSMRRSTSALLLSPCGGSTIMKVLHPTVIYASSLRTCSTSSTPQKIVVPTSREELNRLAHEAAPRVQEEKRLRDAKYPKQPPRSQEEQQEAKRIRDEERLLDVEKFIMGRIDEGVKDCRNAAIRYARMINWLPFHIGIFDKDDDLTAKLIAMLHEILKREIPARLPGVTMEISDPSYYDNGEDQHFTIYVTFDWGDK